MCSECKKETTSGNIWRVVGTTINIRASVFTELFRYSLIFKLHCYVLQRENQEEEYI